MENEINPIAAQGSLSQHLRVDQFTWAAVCYQVQVVSIVAEVDVRRLSNIGAGPWQVENNLIDIFNYWNVERKDPECLKKSSQSLLSQHANPDQLFVLLF